MPQLTIGAHPLHYFEHGAANASAGRPTLLLIHGAGGNHIHWPPHVRRLKGWHVIALDLPGHGESSGPGRDTVVDYAGDVAAFINGMGLNRVILGGHSLGGAIAQQVAVDATSHVAGLILVATSPRLRVSPDILENTMTNFELVVDFIQQYGYGPEIDPQTKLLGRHLLHQMDRKVLLGDYMACEGFDLRPRLDEIRVPSLIIGAEMDEMTPPRFSQALHDALPGSTLVIYQQTGHMIPAERPEQLGRDMLTWLENTFGTS